MDMPTVTEAKRIRLQPGDGLLIKVNGPLTQEAAKLIKATVEDIWPKVNCLVTDAADIQVVEGLGCRDGQAATPSETATRDRFHG